MRVVFDGGYGELKLLDSPNKVLKELGFFKNNRVIDNTLISEFMYLLGIRQGPGHKPHLTFAWWANNDLCQLSQNPISQPQNLLYS